MRFQKVLTIGCLIAAALPISVYAPAIARDEFATALHGRPDVGNGEKLFTDCAVCHGADGAGISDPIVPAIAGQHYRVLVRELVDYRRDKRWDARMEHHADDHNLGNTQNVVDVAGYVSGLRPVRNSEVGAGEFVSYGARVYAHSCASCHGATAEGNDRARYPRLAGQHYDYLLRQMHDAVEGRRPNFTQEHERLLKPFQAQDFTGVADYLSRLNP